MYCDIINTLIYINTGRREGVVDWRKSVELYSTVHVYGDMYDIIHLRISS